MENKFSTEVNCERLTVTISPEAKKRIREKARSAGLTTSAYVRMVLCGLISIEGGTKNV